MSYVISITENTTNETKYICKGDYSRFEIGYSIKQAEHFETVQECIDYINTHAEFNKRIEYSNGSSMPPRLVWSGLGINYIKREEKGTIKIIEIIYQEVYAKDISDKAIK